MLKEIEETATAECPVEALDLLHRVACTNTEDGMRVRYFLFWLIGERDPTGDLLGAGAQVLEIVPRRIQVAAVQVFVWRMMSNKSNAPLFEILLDIRNKWL